MWLNVDGNYLSFPSHPSLQSSFMLEINLSSLIQHTFYQPKSESSELDSYIASIVKSIQIPELKKHVCILLCIESIYNIFNVSLQC